MHLSHGPPVNALTFDTKTTPVVRETLRRQFGWFGFPLADVISTEILIVNPNSTDLFSTFEPPSSTHWLGTDQLGRDQLARLLFGGMVSQAIGFTAAAMGMTLSVTLGLIARSFEGFGEDRLMEANLWQR